jgi:hypothetical protein
MKKFIAILFAAIAMTGCTRIPEGNIGMRTSFDKTVEEGYLRAGSMNQTIVGSVEKLPIREIPAEIKGMTPLASDNSTMKQFDLTVTYSINPDAAVGLWKRKSQGFHAVDEDGHTLLMYNYVQMMAKNTANKVARNYESLSMNDYRKEIEDKIAQQLHTTLAAEKLDNAIIISQVIVKDIFPADAVKNSADSLVRAQNEAKQKQVEVGTAKLEAERISALNANAGAIGYMAAMAQMEIAKGIREGKVQTIVVPYDFKGIVNTGNK